MSTIRSEAGLWVDPFKLVFYCLSPILVKRLLLSGNFSAFKSFSSQRTFLS